jgi:hypothetical protein
LTLLAKDVRLFIGKSIADLYGRILGRVVGFSVDIKNEVTSVEVELGGGEFSSFPCSQISVGDGSIVFIPAWKSNSNAFSEEYTSTLQRIRVLQELYGRGEISQEIFEEFSKQHEGILNDMETRRSTLIATLKDEVERLNAKIKELQTFIANIKVEHLTGDIDDQAYATANDAVQVGLEKIYLEKKDLEITLEEITKLNSTLVAPMPEPQPAVVAPSPPTPSLTPTPDTRAETPIVVRIKEDPSP